MNLSIEAVNFKIDLDFKKHLVNLNFSPFVPFANCCVDEADCLDF